MRARAVTILLIAGSMLAGQTAIASAQPAHRDVVPVVHFDSGVPISGAWSSLVRNNSGAAMTLHTSGLTAGHAVTVWWVIFNAPDACTHGEGGLRCGEGDLFESGPNASVVHAAGHVIGDGGVGNWGARLAVGSTEGALFGPGLTNPLGADIHLVVLDHGPADPSLMPAQTKTFEVCNPSCTEVQAAAHEVL